MKQRIRVVLAIGLMLMSCIQPLQAHLLEQNKASSALEHSQFHARHAGHDHAVVAAGHTDLPGQNAVAADQYHQQNCHSGHSLFLTHAYSGGCFRFQEPPFPEPLRHHQPPELTIDPPPPRA